MDTEKNKERIATINALRERYHKNIPIYFKDDAEILYAFTSNTKNNESNTFLGSLSTMSPHLTNGKMISFRSIGRLLFEPNYDRFKDDTLNVLTMMCDRMEQIIRMRSVSNTYLSQTSTTSKEDIIADFYSLLQHHVPEVMVRDVQKDLGIIFNDAKEHHLIDPQVIQCVIALGDTIYDDSENENTKKPFSFLSSNLFIYLVVACGIGAGIFTYMKPTSQEDITWLHTNTNLKVGLRDVHSYRDSNDSLRFPIGNKQTIIDATGIISEGGYSDYIIQAVVKTNKDYLQVPKSSIGKYRQWRLPKLFVLGEKHNRIHFILSNPHTQDTIITEHIDAIREGK